MRTFLIVIVKLALCIGIALFALVNYRVYSFDNGWSTVEASGMWGDNALVVIKKLTTISTVEYYRKTFKRDEYKVFISTGDENYLLNATEDDITAIKALSIFSRKQPEKITPVPFYVEIIVGILVLAIPFGRRKKQQEETPKNSS